MEIPGQHQRKAWKARAFDGKPGVGKPVLCCCTCRKARKPVIIVVVCAWKARKPTPALHSTPAL